MEVLNELNSFPYARGYIVCDPRSNPRKVKYYATIAQLRDAYPGIKNPSRSKFYDAPNGLLIIRVRAQLNGQQLEDLLARIRSILSPLYGPKWEYDSVEDDYRPSRKRARSPEGLTLCYQNVKMSCVLNSIL